MSRLNLCREDVLKRSDELPSFPRVVHEILATVDDPDANLKVLTSFIQQDPVISARVISLSNVAAARRGANGAISSVYAATSMIGMSRVRSLVLAFSVMDFMKGIGLEPDHAFWEHSVVVGVCAEELARYCNQRVSSAEALIAGLLHDVGQLWLIRFERQACGAAWMSALQRKLAVDRAECERFGAGHPEIGAWLAENWHLPASVIRAIRGHHSPDAGAMDSLTAVVHVAEVLSNGLDLAQREENRVTDISAAACTHLGIAWGREIRTLFGRLDGRARHAAEFFKT